METKTVILSIERIVSLCHLSFENGISGKVCYVCDEGLRVNRTVLFREEAEVRRLAVKRRNELGFEDENLIVENSRKMSIILSNFWNLLMPVSVIVIDSIDKNCNFYQDLAMGKVYYIFNKEYPQNYSAGSSCKWVAKSPPNSKIFLSCDDITMPKSVNCKQDHLEISSIGKKNFTESHKYCGEGAFSLVTQESTLHVVLKTMKKSEAGRFLCSVTAVEAKTEDQVPFQSPMVQPSCQCGWKNDRRIVGGVDTSVNEYPAMVGMVDSNRRVYCGGTIISNRYVLTAAHCVQNRDPKSLLILVGDHDLTTGIDTPFSAIYRVTAYEMWDGYDPLTYQGDIALVQVDKINFNENVGPICLPFRYSFNTFEGDNVTALGWGQIEFSGPTAPILQEVDLEVISNSQCEQSETIVSSEICTFTPGKDTCQSDSGGPLLWQNPVSKRLFLLGIISHGVGCGSAAPGINTRMTSFLEWVQRRTNEYFCAA
ncbi:unnamed protein product [Ceutorhynchus assimilis]|uniref:Venom serine protease 34 n=1 Tax=Ceutorhynchus assimilis TaxID=467358 RepID=A0A9N9QDJ4_9CUCU|nr:unnamed protein product [Ceutorhynchus assimilis]